MAPPPTTRPSLWFIQRSLFRFESVRMITDMSASLYSCLQPRLPSVLSASMFQTSQHCSKENPHGRRGKKKTNRKKRPLLSVTWKEERNNKQYTINRNSRSVYWRWDLLDVHTRKQKLEVFLFYAGERRDKACGRKQVRRYLGELNVSKYGWQIQIKTARVGKKTQPCRHLYFH